MIDRAEEWKLYHENLPWVRELNKKGISNEEYWDRCKCGDEYNRIVGYPGFILGRMIEFLPSDSSVLDIGAGSGAYTIPLAKLARRVTVVEPSKGQIARLMRRVEQEGLDNIRIINKRWEDVDREELERYSLVNAAYCFHMPDLREALQKMMDVTTGALFLVSLVDHGFDDVYQAIFGERASELGYIYLYNVLYQMGYPSNVEIITRNYQIPLQMQLHVLRSSYDFNPQTETRLMDHLMATDRLVEGENGDWIKRRYRDGMIWPLKG